MRKRLLLFAAALTLAVAPLSAQVCTPDAFAVFLGLPGVYPNPIQTSNLTAGAVGTAYTETITIVTVADTTIDLSALVGFPLPPVTAAIAYQKVNGVTGLPAGLSYACNPANCTIPGDSNGCVSISGTPTVGGSFTVGLTSVIAITVPAAVPVIGGTVQELPVPGVNWTLDISGGTGVNDISNSGFSISQNTPNPFQGNTSIQYQSAKPGMVSLEVRDLTGRVVGSSSHRAAVGENSLSFDGSALGAGVYLYTLSNGKTALTRKMIIAE